MEEGASGKSCDELGEYYRETLERFIATKEGFAEFLQDARKRLEELLREANEEHVLMPFVGVVAAQAAATMYVSLRRLGVGEEEALREAEESLCGVYRMAVKLLREMIESGVLRGGDLGGVARA